MIDPDRSSYCAPHRQSPWAIDRDEPLATAGEPEHVLLVALFMQGYRDAVDTRAFRRKDRDAARRWVFGEPTAEGVGFTFEQVCSTLGLSTTAVREAILADRQLEGDIQHARRIHLINPTRSASGKFEVSESPHRTLVRIRIHQMITEDKSQTKEKEHAQNDK